DRPPGGRRYDEGGRAPELPDPSCGRRIQEARAARRCRHAIFRVKAFRVSAVGATLCSATWDFALYAPIIRRFRADFRGGNGETRVLVFHGCRRLSSVA